jgi:hypothetical protein
LARYRKHDSNVTNEPLRNLDDVVTYLDLVAERYPHLRAACRYARVRRISYDIGVFLLGRGQYAEARKRFLAAIAKEPSFLKAWIRLGQTLLPSFRGASARSTTPRGGRENHAKSS